ncbi:uncharacterized protein [Trachinotus anak]
MKETFEYRQRLIHNPDESHTVLSVFPRLLDTKGLIHQDFSLLFGPETSAKLLEKWHTLYKSEVITTPVLQSLLRSARNRHNDDRPDSWSFGLRNPEMVRGSWLNGLGVKVKKRKETCDRNKTPGLFFFFCSCISYHLSLLKRKHRAAQAMDHLVVFHKSCRNLDEHIENQEGHYQPYLLASGTCKQAISTYYIVIDKKLIPCQGTTSLAAVGELFKVHFVFRVSYNAALNNMYTFLQTTVYGVDVDTTKESPKVKELRAKFMNRS